MIKRLEKDDNGDYRSLGAYEGYTIPKWWFVFFRDKGGKVDLNTILGLSYLVNRAKHVLVDGEWYKKYQGINPNIIKKEMSTDLGLPVLALRNIFVDLKSRNIIKYNDLKAEIEYNINVPLLNAITFGEFEKYADDGGFMEREVAVSEEEKLSEKNKTPYGVYEMLLSLEGNVVDRGVTLRISKELLYTYSFEDIESCARYLYSNPDKGDLVITANYVKKALPKWINKGKPKYFELISKPKSNSAKASSNIDDIFNTALEAAKANMMVES